MIQTSKITQPSQYSGINVNLGSDSTINITPFTNLLALNVSNTNNNISSAQLNFNNFPNIETFFSEGSLRSSSNPGISLNINGTNSSVKNYIAASSKVTSLVLKNPTYNYSLGLNIGQIPTGLGVLNIEGNSLLGPDLASILVSFSGMASANNITGGYLNVIPYNNLGQSLTPHFPNSKGYYRELWTNDNGQYQLAAQLNDGNNPGNIYLSTNYGIDFISIFTGLNFRSVAASNDLSRIVALAREEKAYMSTNTGITFFPINTVLTNSGNQNYTDVAMSSNGQYINLTVNGNPTFTGALYCSNDYGVTFTKRGPSALITYNPARWVSTDISSNGQYQIACMNNGIYPYIVRSVNYGVDWTFQQYLPDTADVSMSSDGKYQTAGAGYIYTSSDYGANWRLAYTDYTKITPRYWIQNNDFRGGVSVSSDGKYQIAGLTTVREVLPIPYYPYSSLQTTSGYLITSSNYGSTWQRTNFRNQWGSCNISSDAKYVMAGTRDAIFYTSRTDGADTTYGAYLSSAYAAVQYLRNIKDWTVRFIQGLFDI
jgi:hypothetical protein